MKVWLKQGTGGALEWSIFMVAAISFVVMLGHEVRVCYSGAVGSRAARETGSG